MSRTFAPHNTNRTPWMDELILISEETTEDNEGYDTKTQTKRKIWCCFYDGVSRDEFYESMKAGMRASASAEVWAEDYERETLALHEGIRYVVMRHYETGRGTVMLILQEVIR